ncbi:MAG TPA: methyltransferase domain-containing protein [Longimicrobium sp.]|nr:methyltransferase domain-containing protein [Longimicrobium sp.]
MSGLAVPCPACGAETGEPFLVRTDVPVHQNLPLGSLEEAAAVPRGDLRMVACPACGFVFNAAFDPGLLKYGPGYDNDQSHSDAFRRHLDGRLRHLLDERGVRDSRVVEVGCGNGAFLRRLVEGDAGNLGFGFDPAYRGPDQDLDGRLQFHRAYYGPEFASVAADVVVCRHVIEHVPQPIPLLRTIREALGARPETRVFFETPCVEWILRNHVLWDFFYEHCSLYTAHSLEGVFRRAGYHVESVEHVFGGQYLWLEARPSAQPEEAIPSSANGTERLAREYGEAERSIRAEWDRKLSGWAGAGKVAVWGAGAKGVTFANLLDPDRERIDCVVDLNPNKQGRRLPGAGHPIVAPQALAGRGVRRAVLMNPNYRLENEQLLRGLDLDVQLVE